MIVPYGPRGGALRKVDLVRDRMGVGGIIGSYV